jgi:arginine:pyruvate transaminase
MPELSATARRLAAVGQADAWAIADSALKRVAAGEKLLLLTLGDPEGPPHPAIVDATEASLARGRTHYAPLLGEPALRAAVAERAGADVAQVAIVPGAQHAAFAVLSLVVGAGARVILSDPHYATYPGVVAATGADAVMVPAGPDLRMDVAAIAAAVTPDTRAIFLNSPANPTGAALDAADYAALSVLCERHDLWLVVDEVYGAFRFRGDHVGAWRHGPAGRTVVVDSLSKSHAMTGYRLGWVLGPERLVAALGDWSAAALFGVSQFVQDAALAALTLPEEALAPYRSGFADRAAMVVARLHAVPGLAARMPAGGMFVMADVRGLMSDDVAFAEALLAETGVAVLPGSGFGRGGAGHVRLSLCPSAPVLGDALERIAHFAARRAGGMKAA